jgi:hypothetical protein
MRRLLSYISMLLLLASWSVNAEARVSNAHASVSDDGRFGTPCARGNGATEEPVCFVPFARLVALPERYDGKFVSAVGFLVRHQGLPVLFPSSESYHAQTIYDSVYVGGDMPPGLRSKLKKGVWVSIVGKFDGRYSGQGAYLGAIWRPASIREWPAAVPEPGKD